MRKTDKKIDALWNRIFSIETSGLNERASRHQVDEIEHKILNIKKILVDAGILVEISDTSSTVYPINGKLYAVKEKQ